MKLPPRQRQVLDALMEGMTVKETAETLHIKERTVKAHRYRLFKHYGITNRYVKAVRLVYLVSQERQHVD